MATITIKFIDNPDGTVSVDCDPSMEKLSRMKADGEYISVAHNYAIMVLKFIHNFNKGKISRNKIVRN